MSATATIVFTIDGDEKNKQIIRDVDCSSIDKVKDVIQKHKKLEGKGVEGFEFYDPTLEGWDAGTEPPKQDSNNVVRVQVTTAAQQQIPPGADQVKLCPWFFSVQSKVSKCTPGTVKNIPLKERTQQIKQVTNTVAQNLQKMVGPVTQVSNRAKTDFVIPTATGGAGIGKTTFLYEAVQHLFGRWDEVVPDEYKGAERIYVMVDFSNGCKILPAELDLSPSIIVGVRLAFAYFIYGKVNMNFTEFFRECQNFGIESFDLGSVTEAIRETTGRTKPNDKVFIAFHIDEVQFIFGDEANYRKDAEKKGLFKLLVYALGTFFTTGRTTIQPFISGTAHRKVMEAKEPTMYTFDFIDIPLLTLGAVLELFDHYAHEFHADTKAWKRCRPFLQLIGDMGGLPRPISYLLEECFGTSYEKGQAFFDNIMSIPCNPIFTRVAVATEKKYGINGFISKHRDAAKQVLNYAIRAMPIRRDKILSGVAVAEMEYSGHVFLEKTVIGHIVFRMPFLFVVIYNENLLVVPLELSKIAFNHDAVLTWQAWEEFNAFYEIFMNNFYCSLEIKSMKLGDLFWKAYGTPTTLDVEVDLQLIKSVVPLVHHFPSATNGVVNKDSGREVPWQSHQFILLNGKCASFGDTVSFHTIPKGSTATAKAVIISGQEKWDYNGEEFTVETAEAEHKKAVKTANTANVSSSYTIITVCFTSQPIEDHTALPDNVLIVAQQNFKDYYGPFATRAAFSAASVLNPNFVDVQHLAQLPGVGEITAKEICVERDREPFVSLDDLLDRTPRLKKQKLTRALTYFPFGSNKLLLPFEGFPAS